MLKLKPPDASRIRRLGLNDNMIWLLAVLALDMLLVFRNFTFPYVSKTIVLVVLTVVETNTLTVLRHTHRNAKVDEPVTEVTHYEGIYNHHHYGKEMIEEHDESFGSARYKTLVDEDTGENCTKDTSCTMSGEHVEGIVDTRLTAPIYCRVADNRDDK